MITKMIIAVLENKFTVLFIIIFGTLSVPVGTVARPGFWAPGGGAEAAKVKSEHCNAVQ